MTTDIYDAVHRLEALDIEPDTKVDFLLVLAGDKPATHWHQAAAFYHDGMAPDSRDTSRFLKAVEWVKASGLSWGLLDEHVDAQGKRTDRTTGAPIGELMLVRYRKPGETTVKNAEDRLNLYLATSPAWLDELIKADRSADDRLLGICFGFPPSAIEAYIADTCLPPSQIQAPAEVQAFAAYMLSPDQPLEDLKIAARWANTVRRYSPGLYQLAIDRQRDISGI